MCSAFVALYVPVLTWVLVFPLRDPQKEYASEVAKKLWDQGIFAEADVSSETLKKKILNAEVARWNFILGKFLQIICFLESVLTMCDASYLLNPCSSCRRGRADQPIRQHSIEG